MANSSGFVDFSQELANTGDEERRLLEAAMSRAEQASEKARGGLVQAAHDAQGKYDASGQIQGATQLSESASYSDYLSAKGAAEKAWAAVSSPTLNPRSVRGTLQKTMGVDAAGDAASERLAGREGKFADEATQRLGGIEAEKGKRAAAASAKATADAERKRLDAEGNARYLESFLKGSMANATAGGAQKDYVGAYNPYASSDWAQSQGGADAARARAMGASEEQIQGIWRGYVGKGELGGQAMYDRQKASEAPWTPKKEDE